MVLLKFLEDENQQAVMVVGSFQEQKFPQYLKGDLNLNRFLLVLNSIELTLTIDCFLLGSFLPTFENYEKTNFGFISLLPHLFSFGNGSFLLYYFRIPFLLQIFIRINGDNRTNIHRIVHRCSDIFRIRTWSRSCFTPFNVTRIWRSESANYIALAIQKQSQSYSHRKNSKEKKSVLQTINKQFYKQATSSSSSVSSSVSFDLGFSSVSDSSDSFVSLFFNDFF